MPIKVDNINDLKNKVHTETEVSEPVKNTEEGTDAPNEILKVLTTERRAEVVKILDDMLAEKGLGLYETMLGFTDLFSATFISVMNGNTPDSDKDASNARINDVREKMINALNSRNTNVVGEDMIALLSLMAEGVIMSVRRDAQMLQVKQ